MALILTMACTNGTKRIVEEADILLVSLQKEYAPDMRIELWNLDVIESDSGLILNGEIASKDAYKALVKSFDQNFPGIENRVVLLPEGGSSSLVNGLVNNSLAHLRKEPSSRKELVTQALLGSPVRILKETDGKLLVQTADGYIGWTNKSEVWPIEPETLASYRDAEKVIFTRQYGFSYSDPDECSLPVSDLVAGCILPVVSRESDFIQVSYPDGRLAWVKTGEIRDAMDLFHAPILQEGIVAVALAYHGIPYLWGGASSKALDCSGLVASVYFMNGLCLPRDADQQSSCGRTITEEYKPAGLEPGDLLFFGRRATGSSPESVTHVAIYIGDSEFIHASGFRDRVGVNSMDPERYNYIPEYPEIFLRAQRIIGEDPNGFESIEENAYYKEIIHLPE